MFGWRPGIGDPTIYGWLTVAAYAAAAAICWLASTRSPRNERRLWQALAIAMAILCVNKQLDLQTLFTDIARTIAKAQGWYEQRRPYQRLFIEAVIAAGLVAALMVVVLARRARAPVKAALVGLALLMMFIIVRAVSIEKVDTLLMTRIGAARVNHWLELGGIALVALSALWALRGSEPDLDAGLVPTSSPAAPPTA